MTQHGAKLAASTPARVSTACSTLRDETLMPTSAEVSPTRLKNVAIAARISASAATPGTPTMSMFHW